MTFHTLSNAATSLHFRAFPFLMGLLEEPLVVALGIVLAAVTQAHGWWGLLELAFLLRRSSPRWHESCESVGHESRTDLG